ncbi:histidine-specific methyltransferase [Bombardia bombarda]|uniref:Histidine-specific methyltransferase n=1 Tax=Bombardia bombarda TaxID=252184 RepID=A0AA39XN90_9PEZI|nr:histidine-specific methyltransferase [Bombardia bombarda]
MTVTRDFPKTPLTTKTRESASVLPSAPPTAPQPCVPPSGTKIIDIRCSQASLLDSLDTQILEGLRQPHGSKSMPPLLLWDEKGQTLYDDILATQYYYPYRVENELLQQRIDDITATVASSRTDLVVELGAGNMSKTASFLASLDKYLDAPVMYYALDVDRSQLESSLSTLKERTNLHHIELRGLLGTYDDGAKWLAGPETTNLRKTMVWLGNSIANFDQCEASDLMGSFAKAPDTGVPQNLAGFLLAVDGCQDGTRIGLAYDVPSGESRRWVMYALEAAKRQLAGDGDTEEAERLFDVDNWGFEGRWEPELRRYQNYLVPIKRLEGTIRGQVISLEKGERVQVLGSGKWTKSDVSGISSKQGLDVRKWWSSTEVDYGKGMHPLIYHLGN